MFTIIRRNVFTFFNGINLLLALWVISTGMLKNTLFFGLILLNTIIALIQEIRAKRLLDRLKLANQQPLILEDGTQIQPNQVCVGQKIRLKSGQQCLVDGQLLEGKLACDESFLTGESHLIQKAETDTLWAGSIIMNGSGLLLVKSVGANTQMAQLFARAKRHKPVGSLLKKDIDRILQVSSLAILPIGGLLYLKMAELGYVRATLFSAAAMIGMIPEGLVLLTTTTLAVGAIHLAKKQVLVQSLYSIESLARVDILCVDKTGTLTTEKLEIEYIDPQTIPYLRQTFGLIGTDTKTAETIVQELGTEPIEALPIYFDAKKKYGGYQTKEHVVKVGAADILCTADISQWVSQGKRVLAVTDNDELIGLVVMKDQLRPHIEQTIESLGVDVVVISGDDVRTVAAIAKRVGIEGSLCDCRQGIVPATIYGRVRPEQKEEIVAQLQAQGHTVAMMGDGVNDVLALRASDCAISLGSASEAARSVSTLVLLDDQFSALPEILRQGRHIINNIERSASLFLVKTLFSLGLALLTLFWWQQYPFQPIQLSIVSFLGTGLPGFVLTFEPSDLPVHPGFLKRVLARALPGALRVMVGIALFNVLPSEPKTFASAALVWVCLNSVMVLYEISRPLTLLRKGLLAFVSVGFGLSLICLAPILELTWPNLDQVLVIMGLSLVWLIWQIKKARLSRAHESIQ